MAVDRSIAYALQKVGFLFVCYSETRTHDVQEVQLREKGRVSVATNWFCKILVTKYYCLCSMTSLAGMTALLW